MQLIKETNLDINGTFNHIKPLLEEHVCVKKAMLYDKKF